MRRQALERQRKLNEERRRLDEAEVDLAADFAVRREECVSARDAMHAAELAMGRVVDRMIGELRIRYPRAAQLLEIPEDELRRLRQLATDPTPGTKAARTAADDRKTRKAQASSRGHTRSQHATSGTTAADDRTVATAAESDSAAPVAVGREGGASHVDGGRNDQDLGSPSPPS